MLLFVAAFMLQWETTEMSRSSIIHVTENHVLIRCGIHKQRSYDFLSCAHLCLAHSGCASFNYENVKNGMCELNHLRSSTNESQKNVFIAQWGYVFGQLVGIHMYLRVHFVILHFSREFNAMMNGNKIVTNLHFSSARANPMISARSARANFSLVHFFEVFCAKTNVR